MATTSVQDRIRALNLQKSNKPDRKENDKNNIPRSAPWSSTTVLSDASSVSKSTHKSQLFKAAKVIQKSSGSNTRSSNVFNAVSGTGSKSAAKSCLIPASTNGKVRAGSSTAANTNAVSNNCSKRWQESSNAANVSSTSSFGSVNRKALDMATKKHGVSPLHDKYGGKDEQLESRNDKSLDSENCDAKEYPNAENDVDEEELDASAALRYWKSKGTNKGPQSYQEARKLEEIERPNNIANRTESVSEVAADDDQSNNTPQQVKLENQMQHADCYEEEVTSQMDNLHLVSEIVDDSASDSNNSECDDAIAPRSSTIPPGHPTYSTTPADGDLIEPPHSDAITIELGEGNDKFVDDGIYCEPPFFYSENEDATNHRSNTTPMFSSITTQESNGIIQESKRTMLEPKEKMAANLTIETPHLQGAVKPHSPPLILRKMGAGNAMHEVVRGVPHDNRNESDGNGSVGELDDAPKFPFLKQAVDDMPSDLAVRTEDSHSRQNALSPTHAKRTRRRKPLWKEGQGIVGSPSSTAETSSAVDTSTLESASVISGSTAHSASSQATSHMTSLSSRATRFLKDKRKAAKYGPKTEAEGFGKDIARNILRGKSTKERVKEKLISDSVCNKEKEGGGPKRDSPFDEVNLCNVEKVETQTPVDSSSPNISNLSGSISDLNGEVAGHFRYYDEVRYYEEDQLNASPLPNHFQGSSFQPVDKNTHTCHVEDAVQGDGLKPFFEQEKPYHSMFISLNSQSNSYNDESSFSGRKSKSPVDCLKTEGDHLEQHKFPDSETITSFDSFSKGKSFDLGHLPSRLLDVMHSACNTLSPKSANNMRQSQPIQSKQTKMDVIAFSFSEAPSDEDVAIEVEYVEQAVEADFNDVDSIESGSIFSYSESEMDSAGYSD